MKSTKKNNAIIIFARLPVEGKVKTRLAKKIGKKQAVSFYRVCAEHLFSEVKKVKESGVELFLFYSDGHEGKQVKNWVGNDFCFYSQSGNDLGKRMMNAFRLVFNKGYKKVIIIGTDVPDLDSALLYNAFNELDKNDFIIGPSEDGGYYLLGMKKLTEDIFYGINWGSKKVLIDTVKILESRNVSVKIVKKLIDIDTKEDLVHWHQEKKDDSKHPIKIFSDSIKDMLIE